ncbi:MAG TPA: CDP-diacylglycerol--glycerol-3-phosphate 3-phosphatidyltransferase [Candidatus Binatia bacterium]|nr:CDP-diacylglycerol--glycerol-3-phosphate 3-phosphatidyltransferase [Candidatus Binatia bacterium]
MTNIANILTMSRIAAIPLIAALLFFNEPLLRWLTFVLFAVACVTDFFDGYIARRMAQVSALGRFLDPIADKLVVAAILMVMTAHGQISGWVVLPALIILCREILVSGLREYLAELKVGVPVSILAKWKTFMQMVALGFLIVGDAGPSAIPVQMIGEGLLWLAAALTLVTGYDYLRVGLKHMSEDSRGDYKR